jgi:hypothetical protein
VRSVVRSPRPTSQLGVRDLPRQRLGERFHEIMVALFAELGREHPLSERNRRRLPTAPHQRYEASPLASGGRAPTGTSSGGSPEAASRRPLKLRNEASAVAS